MAADSNYDQNVKIGLKFYGRNLATRYNEARRVTLKEQRRLASG